MTGRDIWILLRVNANNISVISSITSECYILSQPILILKILFRTRAFVEYAKKIYWSDKAESAFVQNSPSDHSFSCSNETNYPFSLNHWKINWLPHDTSTVFIYYYSYNSLISIYNEMPKKKIKKNNEYRWYYKYIYIYNAKSIDFSFSSRPNSFHNSYLSMHFCHSARDLQHNCIYIYVYLWETTEALGDSSGNLASLIAL